MKHSVVFLLAFFLLLPATAMAQQHRYTTNFTYSEHDFVDTIPITFRANQLYVDIVVDGRKHRACLDTGSSNGSLFTGSRIDSGASLGSVVSRDAAGRTDTLTAVQMPPFTLGRLTVRGYVAILFPSHMRRDYDALLGFDLINKGLCCKIDVKQGYMVITDRRDFFRDEEGYRLKYKLKWFVPYVMVSPFKRHVDEVLFDTGSSQLFTMNKQSFEEHAYKSKQVNRQVESRLKGSLAIGTLGAEKTDDVVFLHLERLKWDEFSFTDVRTVTTQGASRLGAAICNYGMVTIDGFRRSITFRPYNHADSVAVENKAYSVAYVPKDGRPSVGLIVPTSDAYKAGLRQGDVILAIDNRPIASFEAFQQYGFIEGQTYKLLVRTAEGRNKIVMIKK